MNQAPRDTGSSRQRPLKFPAMNDRVEPWDGLTERYQQECRQALCQMLVAIVCHSRSPIDDHRGSLNKTQEGLTHD
jgi:hypothetical protein